MSGNREHADGEHADREHMDREHVDRERGAPGTRFAHGPSATEEVPAAPGWVEERVEQILSVLPQEPALLAARNAYLDCLAAAGAPNAEIGDAHDRCRSTLMRELHERLGSHQVELRTVGSELEAMEAELSDRV